MTERTHTGTEPSKRRPESDDDRPGGQLPPRALPLRPPAAQPGTVHRGRAVRTIRVRELFG
ncbi:hypothetical protein ACWCP6_29320 [Streptomyces sp. NPDC002004]